MKSMRPIPRWPDQGVAAQHGIRETSSGPLSVDAVGARWPEVPLSLNIDDRRGEGKLLPVFSELLASALRNSAPGTYTWDEVIDMFKHPMTPLKRNVPVQPTGPLSQQAGFDDVDTVFGSLAPRVPRTTSR